MARRTVLGRISDRQQDQPAGSADTCAGGESTRTDPGPPSTAPRPEPTAGSVSPDPEHGLRIIRATDARGESVAPRAPEPQPERDRKPQAPILPDDTIHTRSRGESARDDGYQTRMRGESTG